MKKILMIICAAMAVAACSNRQAKVPAFDTGNLDNSVSPKDDFYAYAVGGWQKANPLKPEFARFGSFDVLRENNVTRLNDLFAEMAKMKPEKGTVDQKISDLYKMGLDSVRLNAEGAAPIRPGIDRIYAASDKEALARVVAELHTKGRGLSSAHTSRPTSRTATPRSSISARVASE